MDWSVSIAIIDWIFLLALFPVAFFWLRRAWRIVVKRDFSEVAIKKGVPPVNAEKYAPYEMAINLVGGVVMVGVLMSVLGVPIMSIFGLLPESADSYVLAREDWIAVAGSTLWLKLFMSFALGRQAHGLSLARKNKSKETDNSNQ
jgi:hypothetical protein